MDEADIRVFADPERLVEAATEEIAGVLAQTLVEAPLATFALAGGGTPRPVYSRLATEPLGRRVDWARIRFFWGDERFVPPTHPDSNFAMASAALLSRVPAAEANVHHIRCDLEAPEEAARSYEAELRRFVPGAPVPQLDLVLLGLGEDCHTASLFPGIDTDPGRLVVATFVPKLGAHRITMTLRMLNAAHCVMFIVAGRAKAAAVSRALSRAEGCPAAMVRPATGRLLWMLDSDAASALDRPKPVGTSPAGDP